MVTMMTLPLSAIIILVTVNTVLPRAVVQQCTCWEGYRIDVTNSGPQCVATNEFHIMPCNMARAPRCACSGRVSNILKDRTGTWCTRYSNGQELMRWPCENGKEWDDFFRKNPDFV